MQYEIKGTPFPAVICHLQDGEQMITEGGGMSWMTPNMVMETTTNGGLGKAFGRLFSGDKMFQNRYTCRGGEGMISFTSCCPGNIRAVEIHPAACRLPWHIILYPRSLLISCCLSGSVSIPRSHLDNRHPLCSEIR